MHADYCSNGSTSVESECQELAQAHITYYHTFSSCLAWALWLVSPALTLASHWLLAQLCRTSHAGSRHEWGVRVKFLAGERRQRRHSGESDVESWAKDAMRCLDPLLPPALSCQPKSRSPICHRQPIRGLLASHWPIRGLLASHWPIWNDQRPISPCLTLCPLSSETASVYEIQGSGNCQLTQLNECLCDWICYFDIIMRDEEINWQIFVSIPLIEMYCCTFLILPIESCTEQQLVLVSLSPNRAAVLCVSRNSADHNNVHRSSERSGVGVSRARDTGRGQWSLSPERGPVTVTTIHSR